MLTLDLYYLDHRNTSKPVIIACKERGRIIGRGREEEFTEHRCQDIGR
jgi:hypothetical protein